MLTLTEIDLSSSFEIIAGDIERAMSRATALGLTLVAEHRARRYFLLATDTRVHCFVSDRDDSCIADFFELVVD